MPRRKQVRRMTVQDIRRILRLTHEQGLSVREVSQRLKLSKTTVATYLHRAREAGLNSWPLPAGRDDDATLQAALFQQAGRPARDDAEPDWGYIRANHLWQRPFDMPWAVCPKHGPTSTTAFWSWTTTPPNAP